MGPAIIAKQFDGNETVLNNLARLQSWRDLGAAAGPIVTGFALIYVSAGLQHFILAIIFGLLLLFWLQNLQKFCLTLPCTNIVVCDYPYNLIWLQLNDHFFNQPLLAEEMGCSNNKFAHSYPVIFVFRQK